MCLPGVFSSFYRKDASDRVKKHLNNGIGLEIHLFLLGSGRGGEWNTQR